MKFSHIADCHIGGWRDPRLRALNTKAFFSAMDTSMKEKVDFILIAGDLFNSALPGIDRLKDVVKKFKELKDKGIPVYIIPGSHDYSPSGKTMLDVLEEAGLFINVVKGSVDEQGMLNLRFTIDKKTGAKITGMLGKRGMLEKRYYEELNTEALEKEPGFKIFMFHTSITELKPKSMEKMASSPISLLPKGFDYYAGGHVHIIEKRDLPGYKNVIYPGPLFPNNFHELEELKKGGFYIYDDGKVIRKDVEIKKILPISVDAGHKASEIVQSEITEELKEKDVKDAVIMIRISGRLASGKVSDIGFKEIYDNLLERGAYFVMRNTSGMKSEEYEEIKVETESSENIESRLIDEHAGQINVDGWDQEKEKSMIKSLMRILSQERKEGERAYEFEDRIKSEIDSLLFR